MVPKEYVCYNNKAIKGYGYLKDEILNLTIGKKYLFHSDIVDLPDHLKIMDDNGDIIDIYLLKYFFMSIDEWREKQLKELGI